MHHSKKVYYSHPIIFYVESIEKEAIEIIKSNFKKKLKSLTPAIIPF